MVLQKIQSGCDVAVNQAVNLSHVVELHDFPPTLKTSDLDDVLHQLKLQKYYELIWVDDTHAFVIMVCIRFCSKIKFDSFHLQILFEKSHFKLYKRD